MAFIVDATSNDCNIMHSANVCVKASPGLDTLVGHQNATLKKQKSCWVSSVSLRACTDSVNRLAIVASCDMVLNKN